MYISFHVKVISFIHFERIVDVIVVKTVHGPAHHEQLSDESAYIVTVDSRWTKKSPTVRIIIICTIVIAVIVAMVTSCVLVWLLMLSSITAVPICRCSSWQW